MNRIYLDYASTTPLDLRVEAAMKSYLREKFGNPSSLHSFGQQAMAVLDKSRETVAGLIGAKFSEVVFTSSATEANNLALRGVVKAFKGKRPRMIVSAIEHESILETARDLEKEEVEVVYIPVDKNGFVNLKKLEESLNEKTVLVSIIYANNETGVIQDLPKIKKILNTKYLILNTKAPLLHTDATQAFNYLDCNVNALGVDLMTLSSHKIYGPKGAGCLYVRGLQSNSLVTSHYSLAPVLTGGGQEFELRSGTENIPAIVGFAKAAEIAGRLREREAKRVGQLRDYLWEKLKAIKGIQLNGSLKNRLPNNLNVYFLNRKAQDLLIALDLAGIAVSAGSACASRSLEVSHVLLAMGLNNERATGSIRFSLGRETSKQEISQAAKITLKLL